MRRVNVPEFCTEWASSNDAGGGNQPVSFSRHAIEQELANLLYAKDGVVFERLVVRRLPENAVCLQGVMRLEQGETFDVEDYVKCLIGVDTVINQLSVQRSAPCGEETHFFGEDTVVG